MAVLIQPALHCPQLASLVHHSSLNIQRSLTWTLFRHPKGAQVSQVSQASRTLCTSSTWTFSLRKSTHRTSCQVQTSSTAVSLSSTSSASISVTGLAKASCALLVTTCHPHTFRNLLTMFSHASSTISGRSSPAALLSSPTLPECLKKGAAAYYYAPMKQV